jgi:glycosyltransferase involved in cell wall biosynthesis
MAGAPAGGAELFFERLTVALQRSGHTVLAVIRRNPERAARLRQGGVEVEELGFGGPADLLTGRRLHALLARFRPRVATAWMNRAAGFVRPSPDWVLAGRLGGYYDLSYYRRCDHLIGNTRGIVRWIADQGWPAARVHYLPNFATDLAGAAPVPRASLGVPPGHKLLLALGRLHRNKGFDVLVRALARIPDAHAVIAGEGPEREALTRLAETEGVAGRLHLVGWRQDTGAMLAAADLLVCPSRHEPLGNVVIEAWSAGRPVIAAASEGPTELVTGGEALLVPAADPAALAGAIGDLLADRARASGIAAAGRMRFEREFAEAPVVAQWRDFLGAVEKTACAA